MLISDLRFEFGTLHPETLLLRLLLPFLVLLLLLLLLLLRHPRRAKGLHGASDGDLVFRQRSNEHEGSQIS